MKIWQNILAKLNENQRVYLLTVIQNSGSSPGRKGFKMMVSEDGFIEGSIGGGIMEYKLVEETKRLFKESELPILFKKQIHQGKAKDSSGMICSGEQTVVFHPLEKKDILTIEKIIDSYNQNLKGILILSDNNIDFSEEVIKDDFSAIIHSSNKWEYKEQLNYKKTVYIFGAGHVGLALSKVLKLLDFEIIIFDNRTDLNTYNQNVFTHKKQLIDYKDAATYIENSKEVFVVIMTTKYIEDKQILTQIIRKNYKYVGVLGSQAKIKTMLNALEEEGFTKDELNQVYTPIGLSIKSQTPEEIAISIVAQLILVKNK